MASVKTRDLEILGQLSGHSLTWLYRKTAVVQTGRWVVIGTACDKAEKLPSEVSDSLSEREKMWCRLSESNG